MCADRRDACCAVAEAVSHARTYHTAKTHFFGTISGQHQMPNPQRIAPCQWCFTCTNAQHVIAAVAHCSHIVTRALHSKYALLTVDAHGQHVVPNCNACRDCSTCLHTDRCRPQYRCMLHDSEAPCQHPHASNFRPCLPEDMGVPSLTKRAACPAWCSITSNPFFGRSRSHPGPTPATVMLFSRRV